MGREHIGYELAAVVLGLWSDTIWGMNSQQRCWLVVSEHIGHELTAVG